MTNVNKTSFQTTSNQKAIVEELIEGELKEIVGGGSDIKVSQIAVITTNGSESSIEDSNQQSVKSNDTKPFRSFHKFLGLDLKLDLLGLGIKIGVN